MNEAELLAQIDEQQRIIDEQKKTLERLEYAYDLRLVESEREILEFRKMYNELVNIRNEQEQKMSLYRKIINESELIKELREKYNVSQ